MQLNIKDWLLRRGLTQAILTDFGIHTNDKGQVVIPIQDIDGNFSFNKYRRNPFSDIGPKYTYDKGGKVSLYCAHRVKDEPVVVICEGESDCQLLWSLNIPAVTSTGGAMSFQEEWVSLFTDKQVYLCFDNDDAGANGMVRVLEMIPHAKVVFIPEQIGVKDITDFIGHGGDFNGLMATAKNYTSKADILDDMNKRKASWLPTRFHHAWIEAHQERPVVYPTKRKEIADEVLRAKSFPVTELLKFTSNKCKCIFHAEKTSSLNYYPDTNSCYCFGGCGRAYDAIDIYRKLHNCSFKDAIKKLQ